MKVQGAINLLSVFLLLACNASNAAQLDDSEAVMKIENERLIRKINETTAKGLAEAARGQQLFVDMKRRASASWLKGMRTMTADVSIFVPGASGIEHEAFNAQLDSELRSVGITPTHLEGCATGHPGLKIYVFGSLQEQCNNKIVYSTKIQLFDIGENPTNHAKVEVVPWFLEDENLVSSQAEFPAQLQTKITTYINYFKSLYLTANPIGASSSYVAKPVNKSSK